MFTSYGHIKSQNKITDFFMILAWASPFNMDSNEEILVSAFQEKIPSLFLLLWQACSDVSRCQPMV